jgi:hypothetical protein
MTQINEDQLTPYSTLVFWCNLKVIGNFCYKLIAQAYQEIILVLSHGV